MSSKPHPDPTPDEIKRRCLEIQSEWTERDWEQRRVRKPRPVETKTVRTPEVPT